MTTYVDKPLSLIEKKKQQWAKEREELAELNVPWIAKDVQKLGSPFKRNRNVSKLAMVNNEFFRKDHLAPSRRSSLPPLYKNQYNSIDKEMGGETSGYGSDNPNQITWNHSGYESSSSYKDDRPKWRDKSSKFWDINENDPPNWVKRGLQTDEEIVVSNMSPAESPQQDDADTDRPYTSSSINRTYIRGQNIPLDSTELAEREQRRQIALEHQEAIRKQLEDRERRRKEERQKRIQEELEEELRIEREQEIERQRKEHEVRLLKEKQERERKRKAAIQEAIEIAEREAQIEKQKMRMMKHNSAQHILIDRPTEEKDTINNNIIIHNKIDKDETENEKNTNLVAEQNNLPLVLSPRSEMLNKDKENHKNNNNNCSDVKEKKINTPRFCENVIPQTPLHDGLNNNDKINKVAPAFQVLTPRSEMAIVLQAPIENLQNMQYAVLVPTQSVAIPVVTTDRSTTISRTENRVLTPTQYRNRNKRVCDSSTQTEYVDFNQNETNNQKYIREKLTNLELNYDNRSGKKDRRVRSEERVVVERPKWGANRPPTRYLKQSEKDPLYQRRKMRQKMRDYKNSSDESQTNSPRSYRKKSYIEKRHRALWRKNDHFFARNIRMYQTEIVPLESDKEQIYYRQECECCCKCRCGKSDTRMEILKIETSPRDRLPDCGDSIENSAYIMDKLNSLHSGLLMKQDHWERSPRTPSLSSSTRNTENN